MKGFNVKIDKVIITSVADDCHDIVRDKIDGNMISFLDYEEKIWYINEYRDGCVNKKGIANSIVFAFDIDNYNEVGYIFDNDVTNVEIYFDGRGNDKYHIILNLDEHGRQFVDCNGETKFFVYENREDNLDCKTDTTDSKSY